MTKFEKAVSIIANEYRYDCEELDCDIAELFRCWELDSEDMKTEFLSILNEMFDGDFTDDCEIFDDDGSIKTFRQLSMAVKKYHF